MEKENVRITEDMLKIYGPVFWFMNLPLEQKVRISEQRRIDLESYIREQKDLLEKCHVELEAYKAKIEKQQ